MAQLRDIKARINSVKKTKKITQAMKMVSAAKFKRATQDIEAAKLYSQALGDILSRILPQVVVNMNPTLCRNNGSSKHVVIVITSDRGLCGGFNTNLLKYADATLRELSSNARHGSDPGSQNPSAHHDIQLVVIGNKGAAYFKRRHYMISDRVSGFMHGLSLSKITTFLAPYVAMFESGEIGRLSVFYNEFQTALSTNLIHKTLLPLSPSAFQNTAGATPPSNQNTSSPVLDSANSANLADSVHSADPMAQSPAPSADYFMEPDQSMIANQLIKDHLHFSLFKACLDSYAAEEGARMSAMDSATDNASDMITGLSLVYNRTRQAKITTELSEIVAGAEALVSN